MVLTTINEDQTTNAGQTVASIIASAGGDRITDADSGAVEGIAITSTTSGNGTWQYSTDNGVTWSNVGTVATNSALLLRSSDLMRFVPMARTQLRLTLLSAPGTNRALLRVSKEPKSMHRPTVVSPHSAPPQKLHRSP